LVSSKKFLISRIFLISRFLISRFDCIWFYIASKGSFPKNPFLPSHKGRESLLIKTLIFFSIYEKLMNYNLFIASVSCHLCSVCHCLALSLRVDMVSLGDISVSCKMKEIAEKVKTRTNLDGLQLQSVFIGCKRNKEIVDPHFLSTDGRSAARRCDLRWLIRTWTGNALLFTHTQTPPPPPPLLLSPVRTKSRVRIPGLGKVSVLCGLAGKLATAPAASALCPNVHYFPSQSQCFETLIPYVS